MPFTTQRSSKIHDLAVARVVADVDGTSLTSLAGGVTVVRVEVEHHIDRPGSFLIEAVDLTSDMLDWTDGADIQDGAPIEISMGWSDSGVPVFAGEVLGVELELSSRSAPRVTLRGFDRLHRLARARRTRAFVSRRDSEIAEDLAREHDLRPVGPRTLVVHPHVLQADQTDLAFLRARARSLGFVVRVDDRELVFAPRALAEDPIAAAKHGENLLEFSARTDLLGLAGKVEARGWDPTTQRALVGRADKLVKMAGRTTGPALADAAFGAQVTSAHAAPILVAADASNAALAELESMALGHVTCDGRMIGEPGLRPGDILGVEGVGKRFSGNYWLTRVVHRHGRGGFTTEFSGRRTAT